MNPINFSPSFKAFLSLLKDEQVDYLLVGGFAVRYYGYSRATRDLDIWTATHPSNATKLVRACQTFGSGISDISPKVFQHENRIIRIEIPPVRIEILNPIIGQRPESLQHFQGNQTTQIEILTIQTGANFEACFDERVVDTIDNIEVNIISLHNLQRIKQAGKRPKDLDDLKQLH
jgi:hypothetical protein